MKKQLVATIGAALLLTSVAACSSGPVVAPTTARTPSPTTAIAAQTNDRTYTKDALTGILNSVNASLALGGTVTTRDGADTDAVDALNSYLAQGTVTVTPTSCLALLTSDEQIVSELGSQPVIAGTLSSSRLNLIATTVSGGALPPSLTANFASSQRAILSTCKNPTITMTTGGKAASVAVNFTPLAVKTTATGSVGFRESFTIGGSTSSRATLEAIDGNLLLFASGVTAQDEASLEKAVDAVVAAAKS